MTSQGSARGRFQRALAVRSLMQAEAAARELPRLSLLDAIDLSALMASEAPERYERAARRLLVRLLTERERLTLDDAQLAIACLRGLRLGDTNRLRTCFGCWPVAGRARVETGAENGGSVTCRRVRHRE
jgi:hypothetical protein